MSGKKIYIFDTTLRDGEQVPGAKLNLHEKLEIAQQLKRLKVDCIEAGFPSSSEGDFKAVEMIAKQVGNSGGPSVTGLARAVKSDIDAVYNSVKYAERPLIHIVLGTSNVHVEKKFKKSPEEVMQLGVDAVKYAKTLLPDVQYSTEDASRSEFEYLWKTIEAVVKAGATIINIPDTVGYAVPEEFGELVAKINNRLQNLNPNVILSVHCHNDTGLATANSLIAVKYGANKVECTINGIGERAGNAALEEIAMGIKVRENYYNAYTDIDTKEIKRTSKMVSFLMGLSVQVNKAITGDNAFAHSSGIHQDGLLKSRDVYEIINPEDVGVDSMELILTARSGKHALRETLSNMGYSTVSEEDFNNIHKLFLELADRKKEVYYHDLFFMLKSSNLLYKNGNSKKMHETDLYELINFQVISNDIFPSATVKVKRGNDISTGSATGDGPIDALYTAIRILTGMNIKLLEYKISSVSQGKEALGSVTLIIDCDGKKYYAKAVDTDTIKASALAFLNGINDILVTKMTEEI